MSLRAVVVLAVLLSAILSPATARAALDPRSADADTRALMQSGDYAFCTKPDKPLSRRAKELCPLAGEIPGCSALVVACDEATPPPPKLSAFWQRMFAALAHAAPAVAWTALGVLVAVVLYLVFRAIRNAREDEVKIRAAPWEDVVRVADVTPPEDPAGAAALMRRAAEAQAGGDYRTALMTYLAASLRALHDRGAIRLSRDRTNGEYVRSCEERALRPKLKDLVREVDFVQFGGKNATPDTAALAASRADAIVRGEPMDLPRAALGAMTLLALALALAGCQGHVGKHDDPAGRDLLVELLEKQGARISSLPGSLANLPMKGAEGPAIVLDAERVPLEDETREHLVQWVKQGGTLVIAGDPALWPSELWAKPLQVDCESGAAKVKVETRDAPPSKDDDESFVAPIPHSRTATVAHGVAMTWPNEDRAPRAIAHLANGELYGALRVFGDGRVLGLASADLFSNVALAVPGNAAALVAMLAALDKNEFAVARAEQGIAPPSNPLGGLLHIGLGPALVHAALFIPLLFLAFGVRQAAPRTPAAAHRRAFAEHVQAVGALYTRRRAATHALAVYAKHVDDRVRAVMPRGHDPAQFLAGRARVDRAAASRVYARAMATATGDPARGDELDVLQRLSALYAKAMSG